jgi:hypothetical protein
VPKHRFFSRHCEQSEAKEKKMDDEVFEISFITTIIVPGVYPEPFEG